MNTHLTKSIKSEKGFTLVELAVVMVIIGLLIGGILKGQEMIENARVNATIAQIKAVDAASATFQDMYDAIPGDMTDAVARVPNVANKGNGNSTLESEPLANVINAESAWFYEHLSGADLLSGSLTASGYLSADINNVMLVPGQHVGAGGIAGTNAAASRAGRYLGVSFDAAIGDTVGLTQLQAGRIDRKLDIIPRKGRAPAAHILRT